MMTLVASPCAVPASEREGAPAAGSRCVESVDAFPSPGEGVRG